MQRLVDINSEIGTLRRVLVHAPGAEWDLVPCGPKVLERFLTEDIFVLRQARREHGHLTRILGLFIGDENVLEFQDLLITQIRNILGEGFGPVAGGEENVRVIRKSGVVVHLLGIFGAK